MENSADQYETDENRRSPLFAVSQFFRGVVDRLAGFLKVTDEDLSKAGVYRGGEGRD
jgi:hypothetical protein